MYIVVVFLEKGGSIVCSSLSSFAVVIIIGRVFEWFVIQGFGQFVEFGFSQNENSSHEPVLGSSWLPACQRW